MNIRRFYLLLLLGQRNHRLVVEDAGAYIMEIVTPKTVAPVKIRDVQFLLKREYVTRDTTGRTYKISLRGETLLSLGFLGDKIP